MRRIKTSRSVRGINIAAAEGFRPLIQPVVPDPELQIDIVLIQNKLTGKIRLFDQPPGHGSFFTLNEDEEIVYAEQYYPYNRRLPIAAYLLPADLQPGEQVVLVDVIEDIISSRHNGHPFRLNTCEAVWTGTDFRISEDDSRCYESVG